MSLGHRGDRFDVKLEVETTEESAAHELEETIEWMLEMNGGIKSIRATAISPGSLKTPKAED